MRLSERRLFSERMRDQKMRKVEKQALLEMVQFLDKLSLRLRVLEGEWKKAGFSSDERLAELASDEQMFAHEDLKVLESIRSIVSGLVTEG